MPLFSVDGREVREVAPGPGAHGEWAADFERGLKASALRVIDAPLLEVAWHTVPHPLGEALVTLDSLGSAVLVVVIRRLDSRSLVSALATSSRVREASWREIASWHPGGADALREDWAAFRESLPPRGEAAPGLMILAGEIDPEVRDAVDVLDPATVTVLKAGPQEVEGAHLLAVEAVRGTRTRRMPALLESADGARDIALIGGIEPLPQAGALVDAEASHTDAAPVEEDNQGPDHTPSRRHSHRGRVVETRHADLKAVVDLVGPTEVVLDPTTAAGATYIAHLTQHGTIIGGGRSFTDPTEAARELSGRVVADGWRAWRFGADGPCLGEALEEAALGAAAGAARPRRRRAVRRAGMDRSR